MLEGILIQFLFEAIILCLLGGILGILISAATVGIVIFVLNEAYGFVKTPEHPNPLVAPQANAMASIIEPFMQQNAEIPWILYLVGAIIALLINFLGISPLAFALGMFIPQGLNTPLLVGGLINHFVHHRRCPQVDMYLASP